MLVVHQEKFKYYFYAKLIYYSFLPLGCYNEFWSNWVVFSNPRAPCTANLILLCGKEIKKEYPDIYIRPYYWKTDMTHAIPRFPDWKVLWAHHGNLANEHHCFLKYCGPKSLSHSWKVPVLGGGGILGKFLPKVSKSSMRSFISEGYSLLRIPVILTTIFVTLGQTLHHRLIS